MATAAADIYFPGNLASVQTLAELRALPSYGLLETNTVLMQGLAMFGDGGGRLYGWDASATAADNATLVIRPDDKMPLQAGRWVLILGGSGGGGGAINPVTEVDGSSYAGTSEEDDPNRIDNDNAKLMNAQADVMNPASDNYGKTVAWPPLGGSGKRVTAEWNAFYPKAGATFADSKDTNQIIGGKRPIDPNFMTEVGDYTFYAWSQNGEVINENPVTIIGQGQRPGNLDPRVNHRFLTGARCRRPDMPIIAPECLCFDPNKTAATTKNGIDTQTAVARGGSITGLVTIGGVHYLGRNNHFNDLSLNGVGDYNVQMRSWGPRCDPCYIGAGNVGDGTWNRHNFDIDVDIWVDGWNANNRNGLSIVDGTRIRGIVVAKNMGQKGGAGPVDSFDPETGVSAPAGGVDIEPNAFTDDPWVRDIRLYVVCEDSGTAAVATLLLDNDTIPTPIRDIELHVTSRRNYRGCHVCIGGTNMRTPYDIRVYADSLGDFRPYELLAGQGVKHIDSTYMRSFAAGYIGYTGGQQIQDLWFENCRWQELGSGDARGNEVRGWLGGGASGDVVNCKVSGFEYLNGTAIGGLTFNLRFKNVAEISSANNMTMTFGHYVNPSNGGALIDPRDFDDRSPFSTIPNVGWEVNGAVMPSIPGSGLWRIGNTVRHSPTGEPGSPAISRVFQSNTSGAPFFVQEMQHQGFINPVSNVNLDNGDYTFVNMQNMAGMLRAASANARMFRGQGASTMNLQGRAPFNGTRTVYVGVTLSGSPTSLSDMYAGIGFVLTNQGYGAIAIGQGAPASALQPAKYGDPFSVFAAQNGAASITLNGSQIYSTGLPNAGVRPFIVINTAGETVYITGATYG